jgi:GT2 family glycosyltransferase
MDHKYLFIDYEKETLDSIRDFVELVDNMLIFQKSEFEMFKEFSFDEWFSGVGYLEDVDFSYRVSRKYPLMLAASARCFHYHHPVRKERMFHLGAWHLVAWWYFA